jgi:hypothetical protein
LQSESQEKIMPTSKHRRRGTTRPRALGDLSPAPREPLKIIPDYEQNLASIILRLDEIYGPNWRFSLFSCLKAINQLLSEGKLSPDWIDSWYDEVTNGIQAEYYRRKAANAPQHPN